MAYASARIFGAARRSAAGSGRIPRRSSVSPANRIETFIGSTAIPARPSTAITRPQFRSAP